MSKTPAVSIVLPTYCRAGTGHLARAIESVLGQDLGDFELIAVDDASVDGTRDVLDGFARRDRRVRVHRLPAHVGLPAVVVAHGHAMARGAYLGWLFDDCELAPKSLSRRLDAFAAHPSAGMAYGRAELLREGERDVIGDPVDAARLAIADNMIPNVSVMLRRGVVDRVGGYDPHVVLKRLCDWDLWQRIVGAGIEWTFIDEILASERGLGLENSIGRTTPLDLQFDPSLVLRYAATERNARLQPADVIAADPFREDWIPADDPAALRRLRLLVTDHCCRNGHFDALQRLARKWGMPAGAVVAGMGTRHADLAWMRELYLHEREFLARRIDAVGVDHRKTLAVCDERLALLHRAQEALQAEQGAHAQSAAALSKGESALAAVLRDLAAKSEEVESLTSLSHERRSALEQANAEASALRDERDSREAALGELRAQARELAESLESERQRIASLESALTLARKQAQRAWEDAREATLRSTREDAEKAP